MKIDKEKPVNVTKSTEGEGYLDLKFTLADGRPISISLLATTMSGMGQMMTATANAVIAKRISNGESVEWDIEHKDLN